MARKLKTVSAFADGSPFTEAQVRWWIFNEAHNGMADHGVTVRIGKRVYIDTDAFDAWIDAQQANRLTSEGSTKPPSKELQDKHRSPNDIKALQWVLGSLVGYMVASRPSEAGDLVKALEAMPEKFQGTGPGGALLEQLDEIRAALAEAAERRISKPRGTAQALKRSRS